MPDRLFNALQRLARSSWGQQGTGKCGDWRVWRDLVHAGFARPLAGESAEILTLTLKGWRALEAERWVRTLEEA